MAGADSRLRRERRQRSSSRRERSAAGDHLGLPRRSADGHLRADREGRREVDEGRRHPRNGRQSPAEAAARRGRPQSHQPVRLHRQQVRVPRRLGQPEHLVPEHRPQRGGGGIARRDRDGAGEEHRGRPAARRGGEEAAAEDRQGEQGDHLQRQRLFGRVGEGSGEAQAAEPEEHDRRPAGDGKAGRDRALREVQGAQRARNEGALRDQPGAVHQDHQRRSAVDGVDGQPLHPARGRAVCGAAGRERVGGQGRGRRLARRQEAADRPVEGDRRLQAHTDKLAAALEHESAGSTHKHAKYMRDTVVPLMATLRDIGDKLETVVPSDLWPLPTYREMLFIK